MKPQVPSITSAQLPDDAVLLDVREPDEWAAGRAPGAVHIPIGEVPARLGDVPDGDTVHVICHSGVRSARVTDLLNTHGRNAVNVSDGMVGWAAAGKPMAADSGDPRVL